MNRENDVSAVLQQYAAETGVHSVQKVEQDFVDVAGQIPAEHVETGLTEAMHSEQTPPFEDMLCESFERGDGPMRAAMLGQLLERASPAAMQPLVDAGMLPGGAAQDGVDSVLAERMDVEVVRRIARDAAQTDPSVVQAMSAFFAGDPAAGRTLGGQALSVALNKIADAR